MTDDIPPPRPDLAPASSPDDPTAHAVLDAGEISRAITRMAHEIIENNHDSERLLLLGIPTRGVPLAQRLARAIDRAADRPEGSTPVGRLDITMYRDDLRKHPTRAVGHTHLPEPIDGATVVLVDDVLFSGRTVSAALDALKDIGRPVAVRLVVLVDRGHRELPIRADHVGKNLPTSSSERVSVRLEELDGTTEVTISRPAEGKSTR
ncbi:bifunctional pyr operon transcriptional regulator/uracil phosphoribosyltransferase PyrR [Granulicoccus sp. GXG6511]|uniref:bifunctional pyr operon transcriptional regulator/uracil phosphoribosyltransferase PyrR n=1 Tax=Granulicoccus sp. GXG6511 TaxID=3381351 RepID=UPI003D7E35EA